MSDPHVPAETPARPHWGLLSLAVFVIGLLILVPSGLCTGIVGIAVLLESGSVDEALSSILSIVLYGGIPAAIGFILVRLGLSLRKRL